MRKIIVTTGNFFLRKDHSVINSINEISKLGVDGIEIMFALKSQFLSFKLTEEIKSKLSNFALIGIHTPFDFEDSEEKIISLLKRLYDEIGANYILFHAHTIKDFSILNEKNPKYNIYMENDRKQYGFDLAKLQEIKNRFPNVKIVLDIDHAMQYSLEEPELIAKIFGDDVKLVHLSVHYSEDKKHQPLHLADKKMLEKLDFIKKLDCPISIELWSPPLDVLKKEIEFVKKTYR